MRKVELQELAEAFDLPTDGNVTKLHNDLKGYVSAHAQELQADPAYRGLFSKQRGRRTCARDRDADSPDASPHPREGDDDAAHNPGDDAPLADPLAIEGSDRSRSWDTWQGLQAHHGDSPPPPSTIHDGDSSMNDDVDVTLRQLRSMDPDDLNRLIRDAQLDCPRVGPDPRRPGVGPGPAPRVKGQGQLIFTMTRPS
ncbi:hypothetical protein HYPSUDRAFT_206567 [Hypholoma sublateritium FD-334 SS-4]|uniref:Uncharacterized protein n=1 Tax=Hypholoma sublateritium (strain FD-334 SS-4) TaxID=945553 RepID=A0A0D2M1G3_HYPSF|nr:hypothetical protein HYPSUDRAFT_206567 [Hypholoma sublateritium FD-334 SS-4]